MIALTPHADGVILPVKAQPGARKNALTGIHAGAVKAAVTAAPERGKANKALIVLLADSLEVKRSQIELVSGETSSEKRFLIRGVDMTSLAARLEALLSSKA
jgi:uncharacterized protein (TIGR00251 family)